MEEIKFLSINTDASFHQQTKCGGWAFVILAEDVRIIKKGRFKECPDNPTDSEIKCIINAITDLLNKKLPKIKHIIINTDCQSVITGIKRARNPSLVLLKKAIVKLKKHADCNNIELKHIKAHTSNKDKYSIINKYLDKWAKEKMREQLK